jgi:hypothetical protein
MTESSLRCLHTLNYAVNQPHLPNPAWKAETFQRSGHPITLLLLLLVSANRLTQAGRTELRRGEGVTSSMGSCAMPCAARGSWDRPSHKHGAVSVVIAEKLATELVPVTRGQCKRVKRAWRG